MPARASVVITGSTAPSVGQAGQVGSGYLFDGVDDFVSLPDSDTLDFGLSQDFAVMAWIQPAAAQPTATNVDSDVLEKWSQSGGYPYVIRYLNQKAGTNAGKISAARYNGSTGPSITSTRLVNDGRFHHVAFVKKGSTLTLYIDGLPDGTATDLTAGTTTNTAPLSIGGRGNGINYFAGAIDDVRVFNRGLLADEIKRIYTGSEPVLVMPFEERLAAGGDKVVDVSNWGYDGTLKAGANDTANKTMAGGVGNYALKLDGASDAVLIDSFGVFTETTVSAWIYRTGATNVTGRETIVSYKESGPCGFVMSLEGQIPTLHVHANGTWYHTHATAAVPVNKWVHLVMRQNADHMYIYQDGKQVGSAYWGATPVAMDNGCTATIAIGSRNSLDQHWFPGGIDDVRIYGRALSTSEIADLYNAGWHQATLSTNDTTTTSAPWSMAVPTQTLGFEGTYRVDLRGTDANGHSQAVSARDMLWQGEIDNQKPRVTLCKALVSGTTYRYVTAAQDYNLVETNWASPCPINKRVNYQSPWLLSSIPTGKTKLYEARSDCTLSTTPAEKATACDSAGNCTTVSITSGGACTAILATPAATTAALGPESQVPTSPVLAIAPTVITSTHYSAQGEVAVTGFVTGTAHVTGVQVTVDGATGQAKLNGPDARWPFTTTWTYTWQPLAGAPDGIDVTADAAATVGHGPAVPAVEHDLTVDVVSPAAVGLEMTANGEPVEAGMFLRTASPELRLKWGASADGSGVAGYDVRWTTLSAVTRTVAARTLGPAGPFEDAFQAGDAQKMHAELVIRDKYGNQRAEPFGWFLVDGPLTPDLVQLPDAGPTPADNAWMETGCTLMGLDGRAARISGADRWAVQRTYGSWDEKAVRLTWTGANWDGDGDLFVYLDTASGGAVDTFTPLPLPEKTSKILLPPNLAADWLVWVRTSAQATLLKMAGDGWTVVGDLTSDEFRFDPAAFDGKTDLYLPFELLGLHAGDSLGWLALAAEEADPSEGLQVWATMPRVNPANSSRANVRAPLGRLLGERGMDIPLLHAYQWPVTDSGKCPNGTTGARHAGLELQSSVTSEPVGASATGLDTPMMWAGEPEETLAAAVNGGAGADAGRPASLIFDLFKPEHEPLADGAEIVYTVRIANNGATPLLGAWLALSNYGSLSLLEERVDLGDIPAGEERAATFHGVADISRSPVGLALALAQLYATGYGPDGAAVDWAVVAHRVDRGAPEMLGLNLWNHRVGPGISQLSGYAFDESGVTQITLELTGPGGGVVLVDCPVQSHQAGRWSCQWDAVAANGGTLPPDGTEITVRLRATDRHGLVSQWSAPHTFVIDAAPPVVTLPKLSAIQRGGLRLTGMVADAAGLAGLTACVDGLCQKANLERNSKAGQSRWTVWPRLAASDFVTHTVTFQATDALGNRHETPLAYEIVVDNMAPHVTATQVATQVALGSKLRVLEGTATDGAPVVQTRVRVTEPDGDEVLCDVLEEGANWSFDFTGERPGRYLLEAETTDLLGNRTASPQFTVDVTCTDALLEAKTVTVDAVEGMTLTLTVKAVLANAGPETLPAGIPVGIYDDQGKLAGLATTTSLAAGGEETLTVTPWTVPEVGRYNLFVAPDDRSLGLASPVNLCTTPPVTRAMVWAGPLPDMLPVYLPVILFAGGGGATLEQRVPDDDALPARSEDTAEEALPRSGEDKLR